MSFPTRVPGDALLALGMAHLRLGDAAAALNTALRLAARTRVTALVRELNERRAELETPR